MTSYERVTVALEGGMPDRVPVTPFVRDWAAKQVGFTVKDIMMSVEKHVYAQYFCLRGFGYDMVQDLSGVHAESEAMGSKLKITEDMPPSVEEYAVNDYEQDLQQLKIPNPNRDGRLPVILEGVRRLKELCHGIYPVDAYIQAPFRHAAMLRGGDRLYRDMLKNEKELHSLLELTTYSQIIYGTSLFHAGADCITISDPTSSGDAVSKKQYQTYGYVYTKRVVAELKKTGVKIILHVCGDTNDRLESFVELGVDGLSLDSKVDFEAARKRLGPKVCLIGNVDPLLLEQGSVDEVEEKSRECIEVAGKEGAFILSGGCGITADTPPENIKTMVKTALAYRY
jgi:uroporphyrinogen decarboxylase